jgi:glycosyltransferase involved in cell wall biosynthesis
VTVSDFVTDRVRERFPELADRCRTLHNGVDIERFSPAGNESPARRVLFVGRISPEKGVHVLLEALPDLVRMRPDLEVTLAGPRRVAPREFVDPSDEDLLLRELQPHYEKPADYFASLDRLPHAVAGRISFLGAVPHAQLAECYRRADVFVFPSVWHEPFGMPVIEAMACGLPVVATRGGAFPEIVDDGRTGLLVPRGNAAALASAIGKLLSDPAVAAKMGRCGRSRVCERFAWDRIAEQLVGLYRELLA